MRFIGVKKTEFTNPYIGVYEMATLKDCMQVHGKSEKFKVTKIIEIIEMSPSPVEKKMGGGFRSHSY